MFSYRGTNGQKSGSLLRLKGFPHPTVFGLVRQNVAPGRAGAKPAVYNCVVNCDELKVVACRRPLLGYGYVKFHRDSDAQTVAHEVQQFSVRKDFEGDRFTGAIVELNVIVIYFLTYLLRNVPSRLCVCVYVPSVI